jgi:hypothetical protein
MTVARPQSLQVSLKMSDPVVRAGSFRSRISPTGYLLSSCSRSVDEGEGISRHHDPNDVLAVAW